MIHSDAMDRTPWLLSCLLIAAIACGVKFIERPAPSPTAIRPKVASMNTPATPATSFAEKDKPPREPINGRPLVPAANEALAVAFKTAVDYGRFSRDIRPKAEAGDPAAQYYLEESLRYCSQNLAAHFGLGSGQIQALGEVQARWASYVNRQPELMQQQILDIYSRCRVFLDDPSRRPELKEWRRWLDTAADNAVPAAQALEAQLLLLEYQSQLNSSNRDSSEAIDRSTLATEHELALSALRTGDAQALWQMADLVGMDHPQQILTGDSMLLPLAWHLLACDRGFDCSAHAEWLLSACNQGITCAPGDDVRQVLEQSTVAIGGEWSDVKRLAAKIGAAVDAKDNAMLPSYLWAAN